MSAPILLTGDEAVFPSDLGGAQFLVPQRKPMSGSGKSKVDNKVVCVEGDEAAIVLPGVQYKTATCTIPGNGTLRLLKLAPEQKSTKAKSGGKAVLLAAGKFDAIFEPLLKAQQPASPKPIDDPNGPYTGKGEFETKNSKSKLGG